MAYFSLPDGALSKEKVQYELDAMLSNGAFPKDVVQILVTFDESVTDELMFCSFYMMVLVLVEPPFNMQAEVVGAFNSMGLPHQDEIELKFAPVGVKGLEWGVAIALPSYRCVKGLYHTRADQPVQVSVDERTENLLEDLGISNYKFSRKLNATYIHVAPQDATLLEVAI
jgi:hypothetical protein